MVSEKESHREKPLVHPAKLTIALLMMITSAVCWGSWANTYKGVKNYRFELFYWDYAVWHTSLVTDSGPHTMGSSGHDASSLVEQHSLCRCLRMSSML